MSSIAGSSSVRSTTSAIALTCAKTSAAVACCELNGQPLPLAVELAAYVSRRRHPKVGSRLGQVHNEHPLQRNPRGEAGQRAVEDQAAAVDNKHPLAEPL